MSNKPKLIIVLFIGFFIGTFWLVAVRYATFKDTRVHYHANFALYINSVRDEFKGTTFYEETQACTADEIGPKSRGHMHNQQSEVVHVHHEGETWGLFFANLGYALGSKAVQTDNGVFVDGQDGKKLSFILNGKKVENVANEVILSEDVLLVNYGDDDQATVQKHYDQMPKNAAEYNKASDPSTCSGSKPITFTERLKKAIGFSN